MLRDQLKSYKYPLVVAGLVLALLTIFVIWFVNSEKTIYTWDLANYWRPSIDLSNQLQDDPKGAIKAIINRTRTDEYNLLHATPPAVWMIFFGTSRMSYILSIYFLYFIPATLLMSAVFYRTLEPLLKKQRKENNQAWVWLVLWTITALNPIILMPLVGGYPDIIGLGVIAAVILIYMQWRTNLKIRHLLLIAVMLVLATLLRRWYVAGASGLIIGIGMDQLILLWKNRTSWAASAKRLATLALLPISYIGVFCIVAWPYINYALHANYTSSYSAYQYHKNYLDLFLFTINHFSIPIATVSFISLLWLARRGKDNGFVLITVAAAVFSFFFVGRIQSFGAHQYYLLTIPFLAGISLFPFLCAQAVEKERPDKARTAFIVSLLFVFLLLGLNWYSMYFNRINLVPIVSKLDSRPIARNDLEDIKKMYNVVAALGDEKTVYILPSAEIFNIDTFRNVPLTLPVPKVIDYNNYLYTSQLDTRDGFNTGFFDANVVVDVDPPGYIAALDQQQIVTYLHGQIRSGILTDNYNLIHEYSTNQYTAKVYIRKQAIPKETQDVVMDKIRSMHENVKIFRALTPYG